MELLKLIAVARVRQAAFFFLSKPTDIYLQRQKHHGVELGCENAVVSLVYEFTSLKWPFRRAVLLLKYSSAYCL